MVAKYLRIKDKLRLLIKDLPEDARIPSERDLVARFDGSRMTIRKAIDELVKERALYRINGSGTYVAKNNHDRYINNLSGFTTGALLEGRNPSRRVIINKLIEADEELAQKLDVKLGEKINYIKRVQLIDDHPVWVDHAYFPFKIVGKIKSRICSGSLYQYFKENLKLKINTSIQKVFADKSSKENSELLEIELNYPIIRIEQIVLLNNGLPLEYTISYRNTNKYQQISIINN